MQCAMTIGERSLCARAQVGAVIVSTDNVVQAASYNGPEPGFDHEGIDCTHWCPRAQPGASITADYSACRSTHAEASALVRADKSRLDGGTIYVTRSTCINCAQLIAHTGLARLVHVVTVDDMHRDPDGVEEFLRNTGRDVVRRSIVEVVAPLTSTEAEPIEHVTPEEADAYLRHLRGSG